MVYSSFFLKRVSALGLAAAMFLGPALLRGAQIQNQPSFPQTTQPPNSPESVWEEQQRKVMLKKANLQRQQEIQKDAEKLLELATELKHSVDKSTENTLSLDVIKKAEQIEKLAK